MLDMNKVRLGMDLATGRLKYRDISLDSLAIKGVDSVVSLQWETPCILVAETDDGERWMKNGKEVEDSKELTRNTIILPMSQWGEEA